jgi:hypothetical protein
MDASRIGRPATFVIISSRLFENDWRVPMFQALFEQGFVFHHLRIGRRCIYTDPQSNGSLSFSLIEFPRLIRKIGSSIVTDTIPVYFVSTATALPSVVLALRFFLRRGIWLFDVYDDYSLYWGKLPQRVKGHIINMLFYRLMTATIIAPPNLRSKFPRAFDLEVASNLSRNDYNSYDLKKIIVTSNLDARLDYEFIREVAIRRPNNEIHIYGKIVDYTSDWPMLQSLLKVANNVKYHGEFPESRLPEIVSKYAIALAPFKARAHFTRSTDPQRFYDYLNAGLEIISTDIPRARDRVEFIHVAGSAADAADIWQALEGNPGLCKSRHWNYHHHCWRYRSEQFLNIVDRLCL